MSRPKKVGYVLSMFPRLSETFILNEILELERRGGRLVIFVRKPAECFPLHRDYDRVSAPCRFVGVSRMRDWLPTLRDHVLVLFHSPRGWRKAFALAWRRKRISIWRKFWIAGRVARNAVVENIDHLHAHFAADNAKIAWMASKMTGIGFSFTAHAKDIWVKSKPSGLRRLIKSSRFTVTICRYNRDYLSGLIPESRKVRLIYNGLDLDKFFPRTEDSFRRNGCFELLAVGRLVPKKGFHVLVEACRIVARNGLDFRCRIVGNGDLYPALAAAVSKNGLNGKLILEGARSQESLIEEYLTQADVLIAPCVIASDGDRDGIPTVILEAMAMNIPVIATRVAGIPEVVVDGETGLLVEPGCAEKLAAAVMSLAQNENLAFRLGSGGRQKVQTQFDRCQNIRHLSALFESGGRSG